MRRFCATGAALCLLGGGCVRGDNSQEADGEPSVLGHRRLSDSDNDPSRVGDHAHTNIAVREGAFPRIPPGLFFSTAVGRNDVTIAYSIYADDEVRALLAEAAFGGRPAVVQTQYGSRGVIRFNGLRPCWPYSYRVQVVGSSGAWIDVAEGHITTQDSAQDVDVPSSIVASFVESLHVEQSSLVISRAHAVFTPSSELARQLGVEPQQFDVVIPPGPNYKAEVWNLSASSMSAQVANDSVDLVLHLDGVLHTEVCRSMGLFGNVCATPNVVINRALIHASLHVRDGRVILADPSSDVRVEVDTTITDCGLLGWCNSLVESRLPDFRQVLTTRLREELQAVLAEDHVQRSFRTNVEVTINSLMASAFPVHVVPQSINLRDDRVELRLSYCAM